tara:strand:+ start:8702 stop:9280 length:579 start_codon:yes stop_codon:yes gene_type:complete
MAAKLTAEAEAPDAGSAPQIPNRDEEAVFLSHLHKLRVQQSKAAIKKAEYDAERNVLTDMFREAKTDGFTRKELVAILADGAASRRDLAAEEERRAQLRTWANLPAGNQADLFDLPTPAQDEVFAEATGHTMGLRGEDPVKPDYIAPMHEAVFMKGWHAGQERLALATGEKPAKAKPQLVASNDSADVKDAG